MKFFILVLIPLVLAASLAVAGWMIFELTGALAGGIGGCVLLILGLIIFIKDKNEAASPDSTPDKERKTPPQKNNILIKPPQNSKVKIKKAKKGDKRALGVLKGAQVLLKNVSRDPLTDDVLIDATVVPVTENGAFAPWYPDDMIFSAFVSESDALSGTTGETYTFTSWKRWMQSEFKLVETDSLRGSCRLQYAVPVPPSAPVKFLLFRYQDESFGKPISIPLAGQVIQEPLPVESADETLTETHQKSDVPPENVAVVVLKNGQQIGPFSISDLWVEIAEGRIFLTDYAWYEGLEEWIPISQLIENK